MAFRPPPDWYFNPEKPVWLMGDGPDATIVKRGSLSPSQPMPRIRRPFTTVSGVTFDGTGGTGSSAVIEAGGAGHGATKPHDIRDVNFRDCIIRSGPSYCLKVPDGSLGPPIDGINIACSYERCVFANNGANALVYIGFRNTQHAFRKCSFTNFRGSCVELYQCEGIGFYDCDFSNPIDAGTGVYLRARQNSRACRVIGCTFDEGDAAQLQARHFFIDLLQSCNGWTILGCLFIRRRPDLAAVPNAIRVGESLPGTQPCFGVAIINPLIRMPEGVTPLPGHITIRQPVSPIAQTECLIVGGCVESGEPPGTVKYRLDVTDPTRMTAWIGHRRWRLPQVTDSESPTTGRHLADVLTRPGRGLEAYNDQSDQAWIPLSVNRYADETAVDNIPSTSRSLGTIIWVDSPDPGGPYLRVWDGNKWVGIQIV